MKTIANCKVCNALLVGDSLNQIGSNHYCQSHYTKEQDKTENRKMRRINHHLDKLTTPLENFIDTDLTNWDLIEATETENVITT